MMTHENDELNQLSDEKTAQPLQNEIDELIQMFRIEKEKHKNVPLWIFEEILFKKYHKDERFLTQYIQMIEKEGLYEHTPYFKRLKYKQAHQKFYSKKDYPKLYKALKPYLYMYFPLIIEEILLVGGYYYATTLCFETDTFLQWGAILLFVLIYYPIQMKKMKFHSSLESIIITRGFAWGYFFYYFLLSLMYYKH